MNPFLTAAGEPTSLAVLLEYVRNNEDPDVVRAFNAALRSAAELWLAIVHTNAPFDRPGRAVTLSHYISATNVPGWRARCQALLFLHKTLQNVIQLVPAAEW